MQRIAWQEEVSAVDVAEVPWGARGCLWKGPWGGDADRAIDIPDYVAVGGEDFDFTFTVVL